MYPFGERNPSSKLMIELIASKVYTKDQLKEYTFSLLSRRPEKINELLLLNKLIEVFTDE